MPNFSGKIVLDGMPPLSFAGKVATVKDCSKFFKAAQITLARAVKVFPDLKDSKVKAIQLRAE